VNVNGYRAEIRKAIKSLHGFEGRHLETVPVTEVFRGQTAWEGDVEIFALVGHPVAKRCYAWGHKKDDGSGWEITTVLEVPPVTSPQTAVKAAIVAAAKRTSH